MPDFNWSAMWGFLTVVSGVMTITTLLFWNCKWFCGPRYSAITDFDRWHPMGWLVAFIITGAVTALTGGL